MPTEPLAIVQICSAREAIYGAVQSLMTLAKMQVEAGNRVEFVTFKGKRFGQQVRDQGFVAQEVKVRGKLDPVGILAMRDILKRGKFDVVHTHLSTSSVNGCLAARLARIPCVATVHGMSGKLSFVAANRVIAVSQSVKQHLVQQGVLPSRISVVYNGLDRIPSLMSKEEARNFLGLPLGVPVLGSVSRVTPLKAIDDGIRVLHQLSAEFPTARYLVVGDGDAIDACRQLAADLGVADRVIFAGYQRDISPHLAAMDLFLFPTLKEAMGIALVEAMGVGLPVVSTNVGGIPEVVVDGVGRLVGPHEPEAMAMAAAELLRNEGMRTQMGEQARIRALDVFGPKAMQDATDLVYRDLIDRSGRGFAKVAQAPYRAG